jgi:hypothetical protein
MRYSMAQGESVVHAYRTDEPYFGCGARQGLEGFVPCGVSMHPTVTLPVELALTTARRAGNHFGPTVFGESELPDEPNRAAQRCSKRL